MPPLALCSAARLKAASLSPLPLPLAIANGGDGSRAHHQRTSTSSSQPNPSTASAPFTSSRDEALRSSSQPREDAVYQHRRDLSHVRAKLNRDAHRVEERQVRSSQRRRDADDD